MTYAGRTARAVIFTLLAVMPALPALAQGETHQTQELSVEATVLVDGLAHPWAVDFLPDNTAIVTERPGQMRLLTQEGLSEPIEGVPEVWANGQGGLLDVAVPPDFDQSEEIFFTYSEPGDGGAGTALARARLVREGEAARLEELEVIFSMERKTSTPQHFGSRIVFHPEDDTLFVTTGDRGEGARAQDWQDTAGAVLRFNRDGSIPEGNPFVESPDSLPAIWSKGHRNIQGATFDPVTNALWVHEHGPRGGDELNQPEAGANYGWPEISYGVNYSGTPVGTGEETAEGFEEAVHYWDPSIAPSGLVTYQGEMFPEWEGDFLLGALSFELLARLDRDADGNVVEEERMFEGEFGRIRDVAVAPDGAVWLVTDESNGRIIRLSRAD